MVRADLATRLRQAQPALGGQLRERSLLGALLKAVNATADPDRVAEAILGQFALWIPAASHAALVSDLSGPPVVIARRNAPAEFDPALQRVTAWVMRHGEAFTTANLARDQRITGPAASLVAVPLAGRRALGALVAVDAPASRPPRLWRTVEQAMGEVLEHGAVGLENALRLQHVEALSVTDDLTGLYNSRYLNQVLRRESKRAARTGRPLSLLFLDLDGFKAINDRYGHLAGSRALVETAALLQDSARESDIVARFGGDEFALVLPETNCPGALFVARRVRDRIAQHTFLASDGFDIRLTASVGVATLPEVAATPEDLMTAADKAMYQVKDRGKDGIQMAVAAP